MDLSRLSQHWATLPQLPMAEASCPFPTPSFSHFSLSLAHAPVCQVVTLSQALLRAVLCRNLKAILSNEAFMFASQCSRPFTTADIQARWLGMSQRERCLLSPPSASLMTTVLLPQPRLASKTRCISDAKVFLALN